MKEHGVETIVENDVMNDHQLSGLVIVGVWQDRKLQCVRYIITCGYVRVLFA